MCVYIYSYVSLYVSEMNKQWYKGQDEEIHIIFVLQVLTLPVKLFESGLGLVVNTYCEL